MILQEIQGTVIPSNLRVAEKQSVRFGDQVVHSIDDRDAKHSPQQPSINTTAQLDTGTHTVSQTPDRSNLRDGLDNSHIEGNHSPEEMKSAIDPQAPVLQISIPSDSAANRGALLSSGSGQSGKGRMQFTGQPLVIPTCSVTSTNYTPISMPQSSACFTTADPDPIPHKSSKTTKEAIDISVPCPKCLL